MGKKCIIVGAGEYSDTLDEQIVINAGDYCIAADGGIDILREKNIHPDMIIGDMDSEKGGQSPSLISTLSYVKLANEKRGLSPILIKLPCEKDDTDMLAAIREGLRLGYKDFALYGALGGRIDHSLANIQCLDFLYNQGAAGVLYGKNTQISLIGNGQSFVFGKDTQRRYVSVFAFAGEAFGVTIKGLKYEIEDSTLRTDFPIGVSNEFIGNESIISVKKGKLLIILGELIK